MTDLFFGHTETEANANLDPLWAMVRTQRGLNVTDAAYGAKGDGVTDDAPAVQRAVNAAVAGSLQEIFFPPGTYYFAAPVLLTTELASYHIFGASMASRFSSTAPAAILKGAAGMEAIFKSTANAFSIEIDHLSAFAGNSSTGVVSFFKSTGHGYPASPIHIHDNFFFQFNKAIYSSLPGTGTSTGVCNVDVHNNVFFAGVYALYGDGDAGSIMNLTFHRNVSEQGGKIKIVAPGAGGFVDIRWNLLEGQTDAIDIAAGLTTCVVKYNYFEGNDGVLARFVATNGNSSFEMGPNYVTVSPNARITAQNCYMDCRDEGIPVDANLLARRSRVRGSGFRSSLTPGSPNTVVNNVDFAMVNAQGTLPAAVGGAIVRWGTNVQPTPLGMRSISQFTTNSPVITVANGLSAGDSVVVTALIRSVDATNVLLVLFDNTTTPLTVSSSVPLNAVGEWTLIVASLYTAGISTGNYKLRFVTDGTAVVADFYSYTKSAIADTDVLYACYPRTEGSGTATMALNATSVTVTHGLASTPQNVTVTPGLNLGNVWVDTIGPTTFAINCSSNAHAAGTVAWAAA